MQDIVAVDIIDRRERTVDEHAGFKIGEKNQGFRQGFHFAKTFFAVGILALDKAAGTQAGKLPPVVRCLGVKMLEFEGLVTLKIAADPLISRGGMKIVGSDGGGQVGAIFFHPAPVKGAEAGKARRAGQAFGPEAGGLRAVPGAVHQVAGVFDVGQGGEALAILAADGAGALAVRVFGKAGAAKGQLRAQRAADKGGGR